MSEDKLNDGGPAFPTQSEHDGNGNVLQHCLSGMSIRDYFAAKALQGLLSKEIGDANMCAAWAYEYADTMLAERSKPE